MSVAYLFDTDAISELLRRRPAKRYLEWLSSVPRSEQWTSAVVVGELYKGAFRSADRERHLRNIDERVLPALTVLPYDTGVAREFGAIRAQLEERGELLPDADLQIAATAVRHGLTLVSGNLRHFARVPGLDLSDAFAASRAGKESRPAYASTVRPRARKSRSKARQGGSPSKVVTTTNEMASQKESRRSSA